MKLRNSALGNAISILVILSLLVLIQNSIRNGHFHRIENGMIIFHAHPFDKNQKSGDASHRHSNAELLLDYLLTHLFENCLLFFLIWITKLTIIFFKPIFYIHIPINKFVPIPMFRAPPIKYILQGI